MDFNSPLMRDILPLIIKKLDPPSLCNLKRCNKVFNTLIQAYPPFVRHRIAMNKVGVHLENTYYIGTILNEEIKNAIINNWFTWVCYYLEKDLKVASQLHAQFHTFLSLAAQHDYLTYDNYPLSQEANNLQMDEKIQVQYESIVPKGYNFRIIRYIISKYSNAFPYIHYGLNGACLSEIDINMKVDIFLPLRVPNG